MKIKQKQDGVFVVVILILCANPVISIAESKAPDPSIVVELGEEVDEPEILSSLTREYTPKSVVTLVNDTSEQIQNLWSRQYWRSSNLSRFERHLSIPLRNVTEVIIGASVVIQNGPRNITVSNIGYYVYQVYGINSTLGLSGQNTTLSLRITPGTLWGYQYSLYLCHTLMNIEVGGYYGDGIQITGFWMQAVLNGTVYPVTVDIERTNGVSLFSYPTLVEFSDLGDVPSISFSNDNLNIYNLWLTQINETFLLPSALYNITFRWMGYRVDSSYFHSEAENIIVWRVRSVRLDVRLTQNVPVYSIGIDYEDFGEEIMISESLSFCLPPDRNYSVHVRGESGSYAESSSGTGRNLNITIRVESNMLSFANVVFSPGRLLMIVLSLLAIAIIGLGIKKYRMDYTKLIPLCFVFLSYDLPWLSYIIQGVIPGTAPQDYYLCEYPGIAGSTYQTSESSILMIPSSYLSTPLWDLLLLLALLGTMTRDSSADMESKVSDGFFAALLCLILLSELLYILGLSGFMHHYSPTPGVGPLLVVLALISWIALHMHRIRRQLPIQIPIDE